MVAIAPFRALRYADADPAEVTSPPHDVISAAEQERLLHKDHNITQIILAPKEKGDREVPEEPNRYTRARDRLDSWIRNGTFIRDDRPAYYLYEVRHGPPEERSVMRGFFARIRLDPSYTEIRRHEKTLKHKKRDRLHLRRALRCDPEPIWMLYRDERGWVDEVLQSNALEELIRFQDEEGIEHRLWRVDRPEAMDEVTAQFEDRTVVIADGHHRYQTALDHYAETGRDEDGSILVCLVRDTDPGIRIDPTHRLVTGLGFSDAATALERAAAWDARPLGRATPEAARAWVADLRKHPRNVVLVARVPEGDAQAWCLTLREGEDPDEGRGRLDGLAVTRVHERLLGPWGVAPDDVEQHLRFTRDDGEAVTAVVDGEVPFAVLMPPEPVAAVLDVAQEGYVMPQKATYFVPKLRSGLLLSPLDEPLPQPWSASAGDGGRPEWRMPPLG